MKLNSSKLFFTSFMIIGVMMCLCSNNWIFIWCGLELSLVSFLPLIQSKLILTSESSMKYFLIQSVSSALLILGLMMMLTKKTMFDLDLIIMISVLIKMGVAPFHTWLLSIVEGLGMIPMMILLTLSKIPPLMILTLIKISISFIVSLTLITGSFLGLNQTSTRKIVTYSSVFNMGLILISIKNNFIWFYYLVLYSFLLIALLFMLYKMNMFYVNQLIMNENLLSNKITFWTMLLSMGGMPPFLGFSIKLTVIELSINNSLIINLILIIILSLLVMFFYLRMTYLSIMFFSSSIMASMFSMKETSLFLLVINILSLPLILTVKIFF